MSQSMNKEMCSLAIAHTYMDSTVGRPFIFVRPLDCTFVYFLVLKSIYDIVSLTKRFVHLCPGRQLLGEKLGIPL